MRKLTGVASPEETATLENIISSHPGLRERYQHLEHYFNDAPHHSSENMELVLQKTLSKIRAGNGDATPVRRLYKRRYAVISAVAASLLIGMVIFFYNKERSPIPAKALQWVNRKNGKATRSYIELADGSKIWLNAASQLTYPEQFDRQSRTVFLEGEAFFDIAANPSRPFIIRLKKGTIKVLGTSFNIKAYENEPLQAAVVTGKVAFIPRYEEAKKVSDTILITPDVKVIYAANSGTLIKANTIGGEDKAWTDGHLIFRNATLEEIAANLERNFNKKVEFEASAPRQFRLTGTFHNNSLEEIMYYLSKSKAFHYRITDSTLVIGE